MSTILWGNSADKGVRKVYTVSGQARDANNDPNTFLRAGLLMARNTDDGKLYPYNGNENNGLEFALGFLPFAVDTQTPSPDTDKSVNLLVGGPVRNCKNVDARARSALSNRFTFLGTLPHAASAFPARAATAVSTPIDLSVNPEFFQNALLMVVDGLSTDETEMPLWGQGKCFRVLNQTGNTLRMVKNTADNVAFLAIAMSGGIPFSSLTWNEISFSTINQTLGAHVMFEAIMFNQTTPVWLVTNLGGGQMDGA